MDTILRKGDASHAESVAYTDDGAARRQVRDYGQELPVGEDVVVSPASHIERRSAVDVLNEAPGGLVFKTAADVAAYLKEEKESWGR